LDLIPAAARSVGRTAIVLLLSGCSLSVLEGLTGGESDSGPASVTPSDAGRDDASFDASALEASSPRVDVAPDRAAESGASEEGGSADAFDGRLDQSSAPDADPSDDARDGWPDPADSDATGIDGDGGNVCGCAGSGYCLGTECVYPSCQARLQAMPASSSGITWIDPDGEGDGGAPAYRTYCEMVADGGGWTLVLKVDGAETTFLNHSAWWENDATYRPELPDLDANEAKLASYGGVAFTNVRIGMAQTGTTHWLVVPIAAASFLDLMQTGFHPTTLGRAAWKSLPASGSLQTYCGREGFNVTTPSQGAVRIGIMGNEYDNCTSCDSWIGFGGEVMGVGYACGNVAKWQPDNGDRDVRLFGYVMVR
jgi:hypothetical protein